LRKVVQEKDYVFFDGNKKFNLNLIGVRRANAGTNTFDDFLVVLYKDQNLKEVCKVYPITTDPGEHWLKHPINPKGTAILCPGQFRGTWKLGTHQNNYEALVQRKPVKVWRDNNKDEIIDYQQLKLINEGYFGINIHRSNPYTESFLVNKWSAGCQVFQKIDDYKEFMELCKSSAALYGNSFTYTLITEEDLRKHLDKWLFIDGSILKGEKTMSQYKISKKRLAEIIKEEYEAVSKRNAEQRQDEAHCGTGNRDDDDAKPDYIDIDGDGDKKEPLKKAAKEKKMKKESLDSIRTLIQQELKNL